MNVEKYDLIVIGGGPAGCRLAAGVSAAGHSVLLLEKRDQIGLPVRCAEAIGPATEIRRHLDIDPAWVSSQVDGITIVTPGGRRFESQMEGIGLIVDRALFDQHLAAGAARSGTLIRTGHQVTGLLRLGERITGVRIAEISSGREYRAEGSIVAGADGVESLSPRWAGLKKHHSPSEILSCAQELIEGIEIPGRRIEFHLGSRYAPGGYAWAFPKGNGFANVGVGINPLLAGGKTAACFLEDFLRDRCPQGRRRRFVAGGTIVARGMARHATDGFIAVGEAANQNNPFTGGGILSSIIASDIASSVVAEAISRGDSTAKSLGRYSSRWKKTEGRMNELFYLVGKIFYRLSDREMDRLLENLSREEKIVSPNGTDPLRLLGVLMKSCPGAALKAVPDLPALISAWKG